MDILKVKLTDKYNHLSTKKFIFNANEQFDNFNLIENEIEKFILDNVYVQQVLGTCINQVDQQLVMSYAGDKELFVYDTADSTIAIAALVSVCAKNGVKLTIANTNNGKTWTEIKVY